MLNIFIRSFTGIVPSALLAFCLITTAEASDSKAYMVGLVTVDNKDWIAEYRSKNSELLDKYGGRILVRGKPAEVLEGKAPDVHAILVVEFPSMDQARGWYNDPDYQPLIKLRQTGSKADFLLIEELKQ
jgi:uncharacterized protein (DUF1330 family)